MTITQRSFILLIIAIVALRTSIHAQDGVAWLHDSAPFNIRSGAYTTLHPGADLGGQSFGIVNRLDVPVYASGVIEGAVRMEARKLHGQVEVLVHSALAVGIRHRCFADEEFSLPMRVGIASIISTGEVSGVTERELCLYAALRPSYRVSRGIELAGAAGITWSRNDQTPRPQLTIGIRMGSVFTLSFDVAALWLKPGVGHNRPHL